jgi:hypothetical protein
MLNGILLAAAQDFTDTAVDVTQTRSLRAHILHIRGKPICSVSATINDERPAVRDETIAAVLNFGVRRGSPFLDLHYYIVLDIFSHITCIHKMAQLPIAITKTRP